MGHDVFGGSNFGHSKGLPNALYLIFAKNISFTVSTITPIRMVYSLWPA